jgi:hypothetical protein
MILAPFWDAFGGHFYIFSDKNVVRIFDEFRSRFSIRSSPAKRREYSRGMCRGSPGRGNGEGFCV